MEHENVRKRKLQSTLKYRRKEVGLINKTKRGYGKKNERKFKKGNKDVKLCLLGTNANGILGKQESFKNTINNFKPSIITVQETKLTRMGQIKLKGYQIFEKLRSSGKGGGLFTAVDEDLFPVLVSTGEDEDSEIITVQVKTGNHNLRIINAYGPQEDESQQKVFHFWQEIENEVIEAKENNCFILIQMDANAKVGKEEIPNDPNEASKNGKLLIEMVKRQGLTIANTLNKCKGIITRERKNKDKVEKSILDYIIFCDGMMEYFENMEVDEERLHVLTKYGKKKNIMSDHNVLVSRFKIIFNRLQPSVRKEFFNFKNKDDQKNFHDQTSISTKLSSSFSQDRSFPHNTNIFFKNLRGAFQTNFQKVRITTGNRNKYGEKSLQGLLELKKELKIFILNSKCAIGKQIAENKLGEVEENLTINFSVKASDIIKDHVKEIETLEGNFSQLGFWKIKKKLCPRPQEPPMAKRNENGMLISSPNLLKNLYLQTCQHRLRQREMKEEYMDVFFLKTELWESRLEELVMKKSEPWTMENLVNVQAKLHRRRPKKGTFKPL